MTDLTPPHRPVENPRELRTVRVDGSQIREALRSQEDVVNQVRSTFEDSLHVFPGEEKMRPEQLMRQLSEAHDRLAMLHVVRTRYNLEVSVRVRDPRTREQREMSLMEAVNRVGGSGREANLWRKATPRSGRRSSWERSRELTRNKDEIRAEPAVKVEDAFRLSREANRYASDLRSAINRGNATMLEMEVPAVLVPLLGQE